MDDRDKVDNDQHGKVYDHPHDKVDHHHHGKFDHYQHDEVDDHQRDASEGWHPCPITVMGGVPSACQTLGLIHFNRLFWKLVIKYLS